MRPLKSLLPLLVLIALAAQASSALAMPKVDGEFGLSQTPSRIARGPDGNMWVTLQGGAVGNDVAKVTPTGGVTEFDVPELEGAVGIAAGPDGNLWVTRSTKVARFAPGDPAGAQEFPAGNIVQPQALTVGPDGNLWTASADKAIKITTAGGVADFPITGLTSARGIASSGGLLWVADFGGGKVFSVTTAGVGTPFDVGGGPQEVGGGPDGQVAYGNPGTSPQTVGRLIPGGTALTTQTPLSDPFGVAFGTDGAYWFAQFASNDLGRLTPDGGYTRLGGFSDAARPRHIAVGLGNTLWVTLETAKKVARVTGVDPAPKPSPKPPGVVRLTRLSLTRTVFRVGKARTPMAARKRRAPRVRTGTKIHFTLSEPARVTLGIQRKAKGLRRHGKCVKPTRALRKGGARRCQRWRASGRLVRAGKQGRNAIAFSGRVGRTPLSPGRYRLTAVARDDGGKRSPAKRAGFQVVR